LLKVLVGMACVAVIAAAGYYLSSAYQGHAAAQAFEAKCGSFLTLHRSVVATGGEDAALKKAALDEARKNPECIEAARKVQ
jgi:hypothetical protein